MITKVCLERTEKCFKKYVTNEKLERHVLLLNNVEAHKKAEFRKVVKKLSAVVWYGLLNSRQLWQPLDAGYA